MCSLLFGKHIQVVCPCVHVCFRVFSRWKEEELEDKIYGEQRMFYGEMKFPEFVFKPSQLGYSVSLFCEAPSASRAAGYSVLRDAVCVPCLPGSFFNPNTDNCTRCPLNMYQDQLAARSCIRCHKNYYTQNVGRSMLCTIQNANATSMSVLLIVGPKCTLAASHAAPPTAELR